jgi:hypothetical protein
MDFILQVTQKLETCGIKDLFFKEGLNDQKAIKFYLRVAKTLRLNLNVAGEQGILFSVYLYY